MSSCGGHIVENNRFLPRIKPVKPSATILGKMYLRLKKVLLLIDATFGVKCDASASLRRDSILQLESA